MNFETKYLIRWGIPGWIFIFWLFFYFIFTKSNDVEVMKNLPLLVSLVVLGVPLGYLIYQIYFAWFWTFRIKNSLSEFRMNLGERFSSDHSFGIIHENRNKDYFYLEHVWHSMLLEQEEEVRTYIEARYRYLLRTVHGIGTLFVSTASSLIIVVILLNMHIKTGEPPLFFYLGSIVQVIVLAASSINFRYYSDNLRAFQINMLNKYLSEKNSQT
jgi:hypothetical protein